MANIFLTGGGAAVEGLADRIKSEVKNIVYNQLGARAASINKIRVMAGGSGEKGNVGAWLGGSILASLGGYYEMWITRAEYEEFGPNIIDRKCP